MKYYKENFPNIDDVIEILNRIDQEREDYRMVLNDIAEGEEPHDVIAQNILDKYK